MLDPDGPLSTRASKGTVYSVAIDQKEKVSCTFVGFENEPSKEFKELIQKEIDGDRIDVMNLVIGDKLDKSYKQIESYGYPAYWFGFFTTYDPVFGGGKPVILVGMGRKQYEEIIREKISGIPVKSTIHYS